MERKKNMLQMIILIVGCNIAACEHGFGGSVSTIINFHIWPCEVYPFLLWILIIVNETLMPTVLFQEISIPLPWWIFVLTPYLPIPLESSVLVNISLSKFSF